MLTQSKQKHVRRDRCLEKDREKLDSLKVSNERPKM